ncbi:unnamed protein product [Cylicocyclus nassatus]|uniref:Uncharacterized protein n=1 Tax=Cylicocyclus nassatus TaxID=53992 RepID=A0AA36H6D3_CYLNA|nr:unnamed protein product [Cylicocyclus nassatus]
MVATKRSRTYEKESNVCLLMLAILIMWAAAVATIYPCKYATYGVIMVAASQLVLYMISIFLMFYVKKANMECWRHNRCSLEFSHMYQVRENIETSMSLFRVFAGVIVQSMIGWASLLVANTYKSVFQNLIFYRVFYFVYDMNLAITPISIPLLLFFCNRKINTAFKRQYSKVFHRKQNSAHAARNLVGLDGNKLHVDASLPSKCYC